MSGKLICLIAGGRAVRHGDLADLRVVMPLVLQIFRHGGLKRMEEPVALEGCRCSTLGEGSR